MTHPGELHFSSWEQALVSGATIRRLLAACALGGVIGVERELRHKDSGLRTNMLICMGAALFTIMSAVLAGEGTADKSRVASNIVQGVGFLGAGLILHHGSRVRGLTTAATVFVVAAIGMTCGAGMYIEATIAAGIVLLALQAVGALEGRIGWQRYSMIYEVRAQTSGAEEDALGLAAACEAAKRRMYLAVLKVLDAAGVRLELAAQDNVGGLERMSFSVLAARRVHAHLLAELRASDATDQVMVFRDPEDE
jgi:putative Mg2+ transporter-C (MgtC) family protein